MKANKNLAGWLTNFARMVAGPVTDETLAYARFYLRDYSADIVVGGIEFIVNGNTFTIKGRGNGKYTVNGLDELGTMEFKGIRGFRKSGEILAVAALGLTTSKGKDLM